MKFAAKKVVIYSMLGLMQVGMLSSVAVAAPGLLNNNDPQQIIQLDHRDRDRDRDHDRYERERRREHDERVRREHERHEREMRRHKHESEREWRERQRRENERHERELHDIAAFLIGVVVGRSSNND